jgi:hypothetical protein
LDPGRTKTRRLKPALQNATSLDGRNQIFNGSD